MRGGPRGESRSGSGAAGASHGASPSTSPAIASVVASTVTGTTAGSSEIVVGGASPLWLKAMAGCEPRLSRSAARDAAGARASATTRRSGSARAAARRGVRRQATGRRRGTGSTLARRAGPFKRAGWGAHPSSAGRDDRRGDRRGSRQNAEKIGMCPAKARRPLRGCRSWSRFHASVFGPSMRSNSLSRVRSIATWSVSVRYMSRNRAPHTRSLLS